MDEQKLKDSNDTHELLNSAFLLARKLKIDTLLVSADQIGNGNLIEDLREQERIIWFAQDKEQVYAPLSAKDAVLTMPSASLTRLSQLNFALFLSALNKLVKIDERVLGLSGVAGTRRLDTLVIAKPTSDYPWFHTDSSPGEISEHVAKLLELALHLADQGREGWPIGTIFVLGDEKELQPHLRQLILNPLKGHPESSRSIYNPDFMETIRELAVMDGAFIINSQGIMQSAGTYLNALVGEGKLAKGLGARHAAALAITIDTNATSITVSASSGTIIMYAKGKTVLELEARPKRLRLSD